MNSDDGGANSRLKGYTANGIVLGWL
jgi:hypothetical protein